jgi:hypothetical protein
MRRQIQGLIKPLLNLLPKNDYPVLDTRLFVLIWIHFVLDARVATMRGLFFLLNHLNFKVDIQSFPLLWGTVATFGKPICKRRRINQ